MVKMSEVLMMPIVSIEVAVNKKHVNMDTRRHKGQALLADGKEAVIHAVNNHDKLVAFIEQVRDTSVMDLHKLKVVASDLLQELEK